MCVADLFRILIKLDLFSAKWHIEEFEKASSSRVYNAKHSYNEKWGSL